MNTQWELYFLRREIERQKIQKQRKKKRHIDKRIQEYPCMFIFFYKIFQCTAPVHSDRSLNCKT